ncbi:uncharacterized protein [Sinocyclocheilus grahami]|uniref:uncharacterized protein n=1 Tax=Sinocyclocheilus grahami TaxID=75366 RepID=UPI0007AD03C9|nr:PREDICTED: uncharacterized protein LOC107575213 [Sinocyclocheilus grahami]
MCLLGVRKGLMRRMMEETGITADTNRKVAVMERFWMLKPQRRGKEEDRKKNIQILDYEAFRGRLQLNQTGSLSITNVRTNHSGLYKAEISHNTGTSYIKFRVTVYESPSVIAGAEAEMKSVSVKEAKHDIEAKSSPLYYDERFRDRLQLNDQTGSLSITSTRTTDSGFYKAKISSNKQTSYNRFTVTVSEPGLSPGVVAVIVLLLMAATAAAGVLFYCRKNSDLNNQKLKISERQKETSGISEKLKQMSEISTQLKQMSEDCEKVLPEISEHHQTLKISDKLKEISDYSERLKQMSKYCEQELCKISERLKQMSLTKKGEISEQKTPLIDEVEIFEQEIGADGTKEETTRSEMAKGESEQSIIVEDTAISQAIGGPRGADGRIRDRQGKSLVVRNTGTEHTGVCTHESTGKGVNEETSV